MYVRNAWYVAAWDHELSRSMLRRIVLDEPVVLFRTTEGKPVALEDRCCHRQAQLSMGKLVGNVVVCPYHGLQYDTIGRCIFVSLKPGSVPLITWLRCCQPEYLNVARSFWVGW